MRERAALLGKAIHRDWCFCRSDQDELQHSTGASVRQDRRIIINTFQRKGAEHSIDIQE